MRVAPDHVYIRASWKCGLLLKWRWAYIGISRRQTQHCQPRRALGSGLQQQQRLTSPWQKHSNDSLAPAANARLQRTPKKPEQRLENTLQSMEQQQQESTSRESMEISLKTLFGSTKPRMNVRSPLVRRALISAMSRPPHWRSSFQIQTKCETGNSDT